MVGLAGLEPARPYGQQILSLQRLPFRHRPTISVLSGLQSRFAKNTVRMYGYTLTLPLLHSPAFRRLLTTKFKINTFEAHV